ncbi:hypothetical protein AaE_005791 [Aphanomyces astaci]|uniref:Uncharacterized protein n=1 Tax=Aphanomyces astaci TaxID=112090 RepID=A0A6A5AN24_APHAT|nr:hypothetical protein AaE_005791 [Aphanomyces astaci]
MSTTPISLVDVANDSRQDVPRKATQERSGVEAVESVAAAPPVGNAANKRPTLMDVAKDNTMPASSSLMQVAASTPSTTTSTTAPTLMSVAAAPPKTLLSTVDVAAPRKSLVASVASASSDPSALVAVAHNLRQDPTSTFGKSVQLTDVAAKMDKERDVEITAALHASSVAVRAENDQVAKQVLPQLVKDVKQQVETKIAKAVLIETAAEVQRDQARTKAVLQACAVEAKKEVPVVLSSPSPTYSQDYEDEVVEAVKATKKGGRNDNQRDVEGPAEIERTATSSDKGHREFLLAVFRGNMQKLRAMIESDGDLVHATDQHGWNGLHWAASQGHGDVLKFLLQIGAVAHAAEPVNLWSPLHVAVIRAHVPCVKLLLDHGGAAVSVTQKDVYGDRPIDCAVNLTGRLRTQMLALLDR